MLFFLFASLSINAQTLRAYEKAADKAFANKDYYTALVHLAAGLEIDTGNVNLQYKYAEIARQFNAYELAESYYQKVALHEEAEKYPMTDFWLAMVKKSQGEYAEALRLFKDFSKNQSDANYFSKWSQREAEACDWAMKLKPPEDKIITVSQLDKKVNSPYSEVGALQRGDTLYFSSLRFDNRNDAHVPNRKLTKILTSKKGSKGRTMRRNFNEKEKHTAYTAFNQSGSRIYFTICDYVSSANIRCAIYYREKDKRKRWKKKAEKLPDFINQPGRTSTHPTIAFDPVSEKEILFFVSDRKNGAGKLDIWYSEIDGKKFSEPVNLEMVNTPENEISPFFDKKNQLLYFSSDGHGGLGGYDIYSISKKEDWGVMENIGKPVNTSYHDLYYSINNQGNTAFLSSNRPGSFYLDKDNKACCYDIYKVQYSESDPTEPEDEIVELPSPEPELPITPPVPTTLEDFLPLALYFDNDEPDKRTRRTSTKKDYATTYDKYFQKKQEYITEFSKPVNEDDRFEAEQAVEDFFEEEIKKGYDHLFLFSNILLKRLENGEKVEIFIKGFTSPRAKSDYNLSLGKRRVSSLRNHFQTYQKGIFKPFLDGEKLIISETSFGETQAAKEVSDILEDLRGSIYHPAAARERRVEIVEVKSN